MKLNDRLERLEKQFISEPTLLLMPDGKIVQLTGPNDYLLTLVGLATHREDATPQQAAHLDLIQKCVGSREPGGSLLVELIQCFQAGAVDTVVKSGLSDGTTGTEDQSSNGGQRGG